MKKYIDQLSAFFNNEIPEKILINAFYAKLSAVMSFKRIKFQLPGEEPVPANYYGMTFAPSGFGKDKVLRTIRKRCFEKIDEKISAYFEGAVTARKKETDKMAEIKFGNDWKKASVKEKWIFDNYPREIVQTVGDSTAEGFYEDRAELSNYDFGSLFFVNNEFFDYLVSMEKSKSMLLTLFAETYDHGSDSAKSQKSEKKIKREVHNVPNNILVYASPAKMHKDGVFDIFMSRLEKQFARRSFVVFCEDIDSHIDEDFDQYIKRKEGNQKDDFNLTAEFFKPFQKIENGQTFHVRRGTPVYLVYEKYHHDNMKKVHKIKNSILRVEVSGRSWRALKLACVLTAFMDPDSKDILVEAMQEAIAWTEQCAPDFEVLISNKPKTDFVHVWDFFCENISKPISAMTLRDYGFFNKNYFTKYMEEFVEYAKLKGQQTGMVFETIKGAGNSRFYCLKTMSEVFTED